MMPAAARLIIDYYSQDTTHGYRPPPTHPPFACGSIHGEPFDRNIKALGVLESVAYPLPPAPRPPPPTPPAPSPQPPAPQDYLRAACHSLCRGGAGTSLPPWMVRTGKGAAHLARRCVLPWRSVAAHVLSRRSISALYRSAPVSEWHDDPHTHTNFILPGVLPTYPAPGMRGIDRRRKRGAHHSRGKEAGGPPFPRAVQGGRGHPRRHACKPPPPA